jgi:hypothetical protein
LGEDVEDWTKKMRVGSDSGGWESKKNINH